MGYNEAVMNNLEVIVKKDRDSFIEEFNNAVSSSDAEFLVVLCEGNRMDEGTRDKAVAALLNNTDAVLVVPKKLYQFPERIEGVILRRSEAEKFRMNKELKFSYEADFLLRMISGKNFLLMPELDFEQAESEDRDLRKTLPARNIDWYLEDMEKFLLKLIRDISNVNGGKLPVLYQFYVMYYLKCRMDANIGGEAERKFSETATREILGKASEILSFVDDEVIMECFEFPTYTEEYQFRRMMLFMKYGHSLPLVEVKAQRTKMRNTEPINARKTALIGSFSEMYPLDRKNLRLSGLGLMMNDVPVYSSNMLFASVNCIELEEGYLRLEGSFTDAFDKDVFDYFMMLDDQRLDIEFTDSGRMREYFGAVSFKDYSFRAMIPMQALDSKKHTLYFVIGYQDREYIIPFDFKKYTNDQDENSTKFCRQMGDWLISTDDYTALGDTAAQPSQRVSNEDCIIIEKYSWLKKAGKVITGQLKSEK